jgi:thymidylate kinase
MQDKYQPQVRAVFEERRDQVRSVLKPRFGSVAVPLIEAVIADDRALLIRLLPRLRRRLIWRHLIAAPIRSVAAVARHYGCEVRIRFTSAFVDNVCILGPDGAGKSTVLEAVSKGLVGASKEIHVRHLKPDILRNGPSSGPVTDPHGKPPRAMAMSLLKVFAWLIEAWVDQFAHGHKNATLRLWDRYYHDLLVDPKRYRYGGPMGLARLVGCLIPKPDLWILLDAPPEVLQARKREVRFEETARQRQAYLELVKGMKNAVVVDASQPLDDVVADASAAILDFLAERARKRLGA